MTYRKPYDEITMLSRQNEYSQLPFVNVDILNRCLGWQKPQ